MKTDRELISTLRDKMTHRLHSINERLHDDGVTSREALSLLLRYRAIEGTKGVLSVNGVVDILNNELFEIYVYNSEPVRNGLNHLDIAPAGSVDGWDIKWVLAPSVEAIEQYPFFDCIISHNDNSTGRAIDAELFNPRGRSNVC